MAGSNQKPPKKHFAEIPTDISEMSHAQIEAWTEKAYDQLVEQERERTMTSTNKVQLVELPENLSTMTDEELRAWAEKTAGELEITHEDK